MVTLRLFAQAREAAATRSAEFSGETVGEILAQAEKQFGSDFAAVLAGSKVWLNGSQAEFGDVVHNGDEVAVLPPVSGG